ncbi:MAG: mannose-6-phosphate isomerase [Candidatus Zambryskibacteria bacterium CG_4_9_14_3_um_filter_42_15]|uniref:Mannose-6-phosphate isomerase n=1 Tax=Candidatus Zambryskibacteria bacterium CG_4_9_14_3_um_filter_42_15 TaxID=1975112 RepID=A0A2M7WST8_9BACT|nr:MAG: mannose-6-phosphate isomerase [Candidatus Zambryskibacteria bacterium CG_4_9_14_3_um_filter_42_15]
MNKLKPFTEKRPWGSFREFIKNEPSTVKILYLKNGEAFSLQKHLHRDEFWRVLKGEPEITIGSKLISAKAGDEFEVSAETNHRIFAPLNDVEILEVSRGKFDEGDIIRIKDNYGRA